MSIGMGIGASGGGGGGAPTAKSANVSGAATGVIYTIARLLGGTSTLSLIAGTNANLTLSSPDGISAAIALGAGNSQVAEVREVNGSIAVEYPVTLTGVNILGPTTASFAQTAASGSLITTFTGFNAGETMVSFTPADGKIAISGGGTTVVVGLTPSAVGTISYTFTSSTGRTLVMAVNVSSIALNAPFLDTFGNPPADGAMSTRTGWATSTTTAQAANAGALSFLAGNFRGTFTAVGFSAMTVHDSGAGSGDSYAWMRGGESDTIGNDGFIAHATMDATNGLTAIGDGTVVGPTLDAIVNNTAGTRLVNTPIIPGSTREFRTVSGSVKLYFNGRFYDVSTDPAGAGYNVATALGRAANGIYGFTAKAGAAAAQMFSTINPATDRWISIVNVSPVRSNARELYVYGEYGGPPGDVAPLASEVRMYGYTSSTEAVLAALNGLAITNFTASGGAWSGTVANPAAGAPYKLEVVWNFLVGGVPKSATRQSATLLNGTTVSLAFDGQSQDGFLDSNFGDTIAAPTNVYKFAMDTSKTRGQRVNQAPAANSIFANMAAVLRAYSPGVPIQFTNCPLGANPQSARMPPTAQFYEAVEGIMCTGGRPDMINFVGGTNTEPVNDIYQNILTSANGYEDSMGMARGSQRFGISPEGAVSVAGNSAINRRLMAKLARDFPTRFFIIAWRHDIQLDWDGSSTSGQHYMFSQGTSGITGYVQGQTVGQCEWGRRMAAGMALAMGWTTDDLRGPKVQALTGWTRVNSTTFDLTLDAASIAAFDDTEAANTGYASDFRMGLEFNTSSSFGAGTTVVPTNCVRQSKSVYRFTVPSTAGTLYMRSQMINQPYNPDGVTAIMAQMRDRAAMIRALKTTGTITLAPVGLLPTYDVGGADIDYLGA